MNFSSEHHKLSRTRVKSPAVILTRNFDFDKSTIKKITSDYIVTSRNRPILFTLIYSTLAFLIIFYSAHFVLTNLLYLTDFKLFDYISVIIASILAICSCIFLISFILNTNRIFIYSRKNGTLTMQSSILNWASKTAVLNFDEMRFVSYSFKYITFSKLIFPSSSYWTILFWGKSSRKRFFTYISYLSLFMDRNRPLPEGSEFDRFREEDNARRDKSGNQPPLFEDLSEVASIKEMFK